MAYLAFAGLATAAVFLWLYVRATTELAATRARLEGERGAAAEKVRLLEEARQSLRETFTAVSADVLRANSETFLQLAHTELDAKRSAIETLVDPLKESLTRVDTKLQQVDAGRITAQGSLRPSSRRFVRATSACRPRPTSSYARCGPRTSAADGARSSCATSSNARECRSAVAISSRRTHPKGKTAIGPSPI